MSLRVYETLPLPQAAGPDQDEVLATYSAFLNYDIPGLVVRDTDLNTLGNMVVRAGLVVPSNAFDAPYGVHESFQFAHDVGYTTPDYHVDGLPTKGVRAGMHHHKTTRGAHELTLATLTDRFIASEPGEGDADQVFDATRKVRSILESTLRAGVYEDDLVKSAIYRGRVGTSDVAVIRIVGESPTVHDFRTLTEVDPQRGAIIRGYTAQGLPR